MARIQTMPRKYVCFWMEPVELRLVWIYLWPPGHLMNIEMRHTTFRDQIFIVRPFFLDFFFSDVLVILKNFRPRPSAQQVFKWRWKFWASFRGQKWNRDSKENKSKKKKITPVNPEWLHTFLLNNDGHWRSFTIQQFREVIRPQEFIYKILSKNYASGVRLKHTNQNHQVRDWEDKTLFQMRFEVLETTRRTDPSRIRP